MITDQMTAWQVSTAAHDGTITECHWMKQTKNEDVDMTKTEVEKKFPYLNYQAFLVKNTKSDRSPSNPDTKYSNTAARRKITSPG